MANEIENELCSCGCGYLKTKHLCGCGCGVQWTVAVREAMNTPAALNRDQAEAIVPSLFVD